MAETLEEAAEMHLNKDGFSVYNHYDTRPSFIKGAKWQAQRMYSDKDLSDAFFVGRKTTLSYLEWFEQFKKQ